MTVSMSLPTEFKTVYTDSFSFLREIAWTPQWSGLDIETEVETLPGGWRTGLNPHGTEVATVQIHLGDTVWVVHIPADSTLSKMPGIDLFKAYLTDPVFTKCIQNAAFETSFMLHYLGAVPTKAWDTQAMEYDLAHGRSIICEAPGKWRYEVDINDRPNWSNPGKGKPGEGLSLGSIVYRRFGVELDKDPALRTGFRRGSGLGQRQVDYAAFDAWYAYRVAVQQSQEADEKTFGVFKLDCENVEAVSKQYLNGVFLDRDAVSKLHTAWGNELEGIEVGLRVALWQFPDGEPVVTKTGKHQTVKGVPQYHKLSLKSPLEMPKRLCAAGVTVQSFEEDEIKHHKGHPVADAVLRHKKLQTFTSRYTAPDKLVSHINPFSGRVHCDYKTTQTATGRGAVSAPPLQQIPKRDKDGAIIRSCFSAPPGMALIRCDLSMIELRIMAELWNEQNMKRAFREGMDLHTLTGAAIREQIKTSNWEVLKPAYDRLVAELAVGNAYAKDCRQSGKIPNFGLGYGAGIPRFIAMAWEEYDQVWSYDTGSQMHRMWHSLYPGIKRRHNFIAESLRVKKTICIETLGGRRRWVRGFSAALNADVQGTAGDIIKRAQNAVCKDVELNLTIHDEVLCYVPIKDVVAAADFVKTAVIRAGQYYLKEVPVDAEVSIQTAWREVA